MREHIGSAGACLAVDTEHQAELVILETRGKHVTGAVAIGICDENHGTKIHLAVTVNNPFIRERDARGPEGSCPHRLFQ